MPRKPKKEGPMDILARIALEDQARKINDERGKEEQRQNALAQIAMQDKDAAQRQARLQGMCDHLLGNHRIGVKPRDPKCGLHKDYLSDKSVRIYCGKCRFEWHPGDRPDAIVRRHAATGLVKMPNPTKKGWVEINEFFYSFENSADLTSRAFRLERVEPETIEAEEARLLATA